MPKKIAVVILLLLAAAVIVLYAVGIAQGAHPLARLPRVAASLGTLALAIVRLCTSDRRGLGYYEKQYQDILKDAFRDRPGIRKTADSLSAVADLRGLSESGCVVSEPIKTGMQFLTACHWHSGLHKKKLAKTGLIAVNILSEGSYICS